MYNVFRVLNYKYFLQKQKASSLIRGRQRSLNMQMVLTNYMMIFILSEGITAKCMNAFQRVLRFLFSVGTNLENTTMNLCLKQSCLYYLHKVTQERDHLQMVFIDFKKSGWKLCELFFWMIGEDDERKNTI